MAKSRLPHERSFRNVPYEGVVTGEIEAWRVWRVYKDNDNRLRLYSTVREFKWRPGQPFTKPLTYTLKSYYDAYWMARGVRGFNSEYVAIGRVEIWGNVIEHTEGYLADNVDIKAIYWTRPRFLKKQLIEIYKVKSAKLSLKERLSSPFMTGSKPKFFIFMFFLLIWNLGELIYVLWKVMSK